MSLVTDPPSTSAKTPSPRPGWLRLFRRPKTRSWLAVAILLMLCGLLFFYGLTAGELYRTESLRAIIAAEFLRSGNWIVPTLYGEPLFTKPPGMYAAIALASWPSGGVSEWTARLPSALAATATVFVIYWYFSRQLGRRGGLLAAALLPVSFMWLDKATAAEIDMLQVAWVAVAIVCFLRALETAEDSLAVTPQRAGDVSPLMELKSGGLRPPLAMRALRQYRFWWFAALACVAGGVLTKWTAPAFFYGTAVPLLWWRGRLRLLFGRPHLMAVALSAGICLAWIGAAVALAGWHPFYDTVSREGLMRLLPSHHYRPYPWREALLHPLKLLAANLPSSAFALLALRPAFGQLWDERGRRLLQALHCWVWPNMLFWSIIPEHAPRHGFPLSPGIAGLAALVWFAWLTGRLPWPWLAPVVARSPDRATVRRPWHNGVWKLALRPGAALVGLFALWLMVKLAFVHVAVPARNQNRLPRAKGEQLAALIPEGKTLYLFMLKDEGIMFYYGRTVRRLPSPAQLPSSSEPLYCILDKAEWEQWKSLRATELIQRMKDEQGAPIVLVKVQGLSP